MKELSFASTDSNVLSREQAAMRMGISTRNLDYMRQSGKLPFLQIGRRIGFLPYDLDRFIEAHRVESV